MQEGYLYYRQQRIAQPEYYFPRRKHNTLRNRLESIHQSNSPESFH